MHVIKVPAARREIEVDFETLPAASREFVINYGLRQLLNDSIVSGDDDESRNELLDKKIAKLFDGTLSIREGRTTDPLEKEINRLARQYAEDRVKKEGGKVKDYPKAEFSALVERYRKHPPLVALAQETIAKAAAVPELD